MCEIVLILEGAFLRILVPTCLHFGTQVEVKKTDSLEIKLKISARGFQEAPRASQEGPRAPQECPKSAPRRPKAFQNALKGHPRQLQERAKPAKTPKLRWRPTETHQNIENNWKMDEPVGSFNKNGQKMLIWLWEAQGKVNRCGREIILLLKSSLTNSCWSLSARSVLWRKWRSKWTVALILISNWNNL